MSQLNNSSSWLQANIMLADVSLQCHCDRDYILKWYQSLFTEGIKLLDPLQRQFQQHCGCHQTEVNCSHSLTLISLSFTASSRVNEAGCFSVCIDSWGKQWSDFHLQIGKNSRVNPYLVETHSWNTLASHSGYWLQSKLSILGGLKHVCPTAAVARIIALNWEGYIKRTHLAAIRNLLASSCTKI